VNIVRAHSLSLHIKQLFEILYLPLEFINYLHIFTIELHWLHFHHDLNKVLNTWRALYTNFSVFIVSSRFFIDGEMFPTIKVKVFPESESWSSRVSFDYRKGATDLFFNVERLAITLPRVVKDWFIFFNYLKWSLFIVSLLLIFYEPAKSHKFNLAFFIIVLLP
jgi:hypothetical protein